jgi:hypothetical protein
MSMLVLLAMSGLGVGCREAHAEPVYGDKKTPAEELATLEREGPAPQSSTQRFSPDRAAEAPPTDAKSKAPTKAEWASARDAAGARITDPKCRVQRVREWYRVGCDDGYVSFLGGSRDGVDVGAREDPYGAWFIFPARVGDVRAAEFLYRSKWSLAGDVIVSEQWLPGDPAPLITVEGIR